ncbi:MAG: hypothetical protein ACRC35_06475 [Angustibacter sp.]
MDCAAAPAVAPDEGAQQPGHQWGVFVVLAGLVLLAADLMVVAVTVTTGQVPVPRALPVAGQVTALADVRVLPPAVLAVTALIVAAGLLAVGLGFSRRRRWAWVCVMLLAALMLTGNLVATVVGTGQPDSARHGTMALAVLLVFYINQRSVQRRFGSPADGVS